MSAGTKDPADRSQTSARAVPLCKDCTYCDNMHLTGWICDHPDARTYWGDFVMGYKQKPGQMHCLVMRAPFQRCGPDGILFKAKHGPVSQ